MKEIAVTNFYSWSIFSQERQIDFNGHLWVREEGNVLIDPVPMTAADLEQFDQLGGAAWIVLTNRDHEREAAFFQDRTGTRIAAHRADADLFDQPPDRLLDDGEEIVPGLRVVHLAHGKSPGEIALYWPALKMVLAGDLVVGAPLGRITLLPDAKLADPPQAALGLRKLLQLDFDALLMGDGHSVLHDARRLLLECLEERTDIYINKINVEDIPWTSGDGPAGYLLRLNMRSQRLAQDEGGHAIWQVQTSTQEWAADQTALLLCDVWNGHWCRGAVERLDAMIERMDAVVRAVRAAGGLIVHAPSDTMDFYANALARQRALAAPQVAPPPNAERPDPPLPVDASDHGSDTGETETYKAWNRQHPGIGIDQERDIISDKGTEVYSYLQHRGIAHLLIMGVHTNMCVLHRTFAIKQMVRWGVDMALIRDLTDAMYNPAMPPYVSHDAGTGLVVEFIEKFWCPSVESKDII